MNINLNDLFSGMGGFGGMGGMDGSNR